MSWTSAELRTRFDDCKRVFQAASLVVLVIRLSQRRLQSAVGPVPNEDGFSTEGYRDAPTRRLEFLLVLDRGPLSYSYLQPGRQKTHNRIDIVSEVSQPRATNLDEYTVVEARKLSKLLHASGMALKLSVSSTRALIHNLSELVSCSAAQTWGNRNALRRRPKAVPW
ncbi:hypothetical protein BKA93DRAFT_192743 [Sparassis latifolia]